jgi:hypothetical protein
MDDGSCESSRETSPEPDEEQEEVTVEEIERDAQSCARCIAILEKKFDVDFYEYVWEVYTDILQQNDDLSARLVIAESRAIVESDLSRMIATVGSIMDRGPVLPGDTEMLGSIRERLREEIYSEVVRESPEYSEMFDELERSVRVLVLVALRTRS